MTKEIIKHSAYNIDLKNKADELIRESGPINDTNNLKEFIMELIAKTDKKERAIVESENGLYLDTAKFEHAWRVATMLADSTMVPEQFRKNPGNCMIALNFADRTGMDPFMIMQKMYVIKGKPGIEGQLAIALINNTKKFSPLRFRFSGEGETRACTAYATSLATGDECQQTVTWEMVEKEGWSKKPGSKWLTLPDQMFQYRSATFFGRIFCPEALLGMMTNDELNDIENRNVQPVSNLSQKLKALPEAEKANPLHSTPEWQEWTDTAEAQPEICSKMMPPTTAEQCLEAVKAVKTQVDSENA